MSVVAPTKKQYQEKVFLTELPEGFKINTIDGADRMLRGIFRTVINSPDDHRLPRVLNNPDDERLMDAEHLSLVQEKYDEIIHLISGLMCFVSEENELECEDSNSKFIKFLSNNVYKYRFDDITSNRNSQNCSYLIEEVSKRANKSQKQVYHWATTNEHENTPAQQVYLQLLSKKLVLIWDILRIELHKRLLGAPIRVETKTITRIAYKIPEYIRNALIEKMIETNDTHDCPVCMDKIQPKDIKFSGCGHMYCGECLPKVVEQEKCAVCREPIAVEE